MVPRSARRLTGAREMRLENSCELSRAEGELRSALKDDASVTGDGSARKGRLVIAPAHEHASRPALRTKRFRRSRGQ